MPSFCILRLGGEIRANPPEARLSAVGPPKAGKRIQKSAWGGFRKEHRGENKYEEQMKIRKSPTGHGDGERKEEEKYHPQGTHPPSARQEEHKDSTKGKKYARQHDTIRFVIY